MKRFIIATLVIFLIIPVFLSAKVTYLSEDEYKRLSKKERQVYWDNLDNEYLTLQQRKADAIANKEKYSTRIEEVNKNIESTDAEYQQVYREVFEILDLTDGQEVNDATINRVRTNVQRKIDYFNRKLENWNKLSDVELWDYKKTIMETVDEYNSYKDSKYAKIPDFRNEFSDLKRKIIGIQQNLDRARPKYYEDNYIVVKGDYLSKISGYDFIYNDPKKWGIIYRANRDRIKDPNILEVDSIIKIPRGLPNAWKVYRGECLWKIASYPEVYDNAGKWPLIYRANKDQIKDPDLIYPNQVFKIPRD